MGSEHECLNTIPVFNGDNESYSVMEYFQKFETIARHFNWSPEKRLYFAKYRLEGEAKNHTCKLIDINDYDTLKNSLIEQFFKRNTKKPEKSLNLSQPVNMSVKDFISKIENLSFAIVRKQMIASKQGLSPENFVSFRSKLEKDILLSKMRPQILKRVLRRQPQTLKQIKHFAIQEERILNSLEESVLATHQKIKCSGTIESLNSKIKELDAQVTILSDKVNHLETLLNGPPEKIETTLEK